LPHASTRKMLPFVPRLFILVFPTIRTINRDEFFEDVQPLGRSEAQYVCCDVRTEFYVFEEEFYELYCWAVGLRRKSDISVSCRLWV